MSQKKYIFKTTRTVDSKICEGVTVTLRKMTEARREELRMKLAGPVAELNAKIEESNSLADREDQASVAKRAKLMDEAQTVINMAINGIKVLWGVKKISGLYLEDDEHEATVEDWKSWPSELTAETLEFVEHASGLSVEERGNSLPPTTSGEAVGTEMKPDSAGTVNESELISGAIATSSFPSL